jgi:hypothetical protein
MSLELLVLLGSLTLSPSQSASRLEVTNIRPTYGEFGPTRPDWKIPLADSLHVAFDINGLAGDANGRVRFRTTLEVENSKGEKLYRPDPQETGLVNIQGGGRVRQGIVVVTGLDQTPGTYRIKVTIGELGESDAKKEVKRETSFTQDFTVLPVDFSIVRLQLAYDRLGQLPAPAAGGAGQSLFVNAIVVGFKTDPQKENQSAFQVEMSILDSADKPMAPKPDLVRSGPMPASVTNRAIRFDLPLMRGGQYKIALKATDLVSKKTASVAIPLVVVDYGETRK